MERPVPRPRKRPVSKLTKFFKSSTFWLIVVTIFVLMSLVIMLHVDYYNSLRVQIYGNELVLPPQLRYYLGIATPENISQLYVGDNNFFSGVYEWIGSWLGVQRYDYEWNSWLLCFIILFVVLFLVFAKAFYGKLGKLFEKITSKRFVHKKAAVRTAKAMYYGAALIIVAVLVGVLAVIGIFQDDAPRVVNVLLTLLISLIFTAIPLVIIAAIVVVLVFIFYFIGIAVAQMSKNTYQQYENYGRGKKKNGLGEGKSEMSLTDGSGVNLGTQANPFSTVVENINGGTGMGGFGGEMGSIKLEHDDDIVTDVTRLFPALSAIDQEEKARLAKIAAEKKAGTYVEEKAPLLKPEDFVLRFQSFLCRKHKLYYELPLLRCFLAGMASSRILILEGLSGTGKSMLPRMFGEFTGSKTFFCPVQATWRDRTDIVGYYSDFTNEFKETEFLKRMYKMGYNKEKFNLMVLDEMNISRVEYYFADFLSILEYPPEDWLVKLMQVKEGQELPEKLESGNARIPINTWFIGTANTDDSTFTITDKVYDRAIIIDFKEKNSPLVPVGSGEPLKNFTVNQLNTYFRIAYSKPENSLNEEENEKFVRLCDLSSELFDVRFGNRILTQINNFIPVYVLFGGSKDDAIDFMFARKVIRKLEGKFDDYIKDGLIKLQKEIRTLYGKDSFPETDKYIKKLLKKFY